MLAACKRSRSVGFAAMRAAVAISLCVVLATSRTALAAYPLPAGYRYPAPAGSVFHRAWPPRLTHAITREDHASVAHMFLVFSTNARLE